MLVQEFRSATESTPPTTLDSDLIVTARSIEAEDVMSLRLEPADGSALPAWAPGAHIDLVLDDGMIRQYSLVGDPGDRSAWTIAVLRTPDGRGGSVHVHDRLTGDTRVRVRGPRNNFELVDSSEYLFIAGGIGITPILPMIEAADRAGAAWTLWYLGRSAGSMAFVDRLRSDHPGRVTIRADDEHGGPADLADVLAAPPAGSAVYCCGPAPLLDAVERHFADVPVSVHTERFTPVAPPVSDVGLDDFQVECRVSGVIVDVHAGEPMLDAIEDAGVALMSSCAEGVCGTCRTTVLDGVPDHRDAILSAAERESGSVVMPCVSRSKTPRLVLDI